MLSLGNAMTIRYCILEGGSEDEWTSHAVVTADTISVVANSLIISQGPLGIVFKYPGFVLHSTIVNVSRIKNSVGIATGTTWVFDHTTVSNTAIFGFTHAAGHYGPDTFWSARTSNNMTDAPAGDSSNGPWPFGRGTISTVDLLPGAVYGVPMADAFVRPGSDWRPSTACPLRGAGSAFGEFAVNCVVREPSCPERTTYNFDAFNIIGIARPPAGRNDVGAW
jgi:hypothetical protein